MSLPRFALSRKSLVIAALILVLFWSLTAAFTMQRREDPGTTQRQTEVVTVWPGATTENVEQLITKKIADDLRGVAHVEHVEGTSRPGISDISVVFDDEINDADGPLRDVRNHLADLRPQLPAAAQAPSLIDDVWKTYPIIIGITADGFDRRGLRDLAKHLSDQLAALPDVGLVRMVGAQEQQVDVALDPARLGAYGISANDVTSALAAHNALVPSGTVAVGGRIAQVEPVSGLHAIGDVRNVPVATIDGRTIRVRDVASVTTAYPDPPSELVRIDGRRGVALAIQAKDTSSVTTLGPEVDAFLAKTQASWPAGIHIARIADQPRTVSARIGDFFLNLLLAVIIVTGLVALFMGLRNGLLVGATVVISIVMTLGIMPFLHIDLNQISILALIISLGIIVDAGIVSIDNIEHHLRAGESRFDAAWRGVQELWFPLLTSTLVAMSSFLPFRLMGGGVGDFVRDLGVVTAISLACSLVVAYLITPILGEWFATATGNSRFTAIFDRLLERVQALYVPLARASLHRPWLTVAVAGALVVLSVVQIPRLGVQFFPSADRNQFFINVNAPDGTDIRATEAIVAQIETRVRAERGVTAVGSFIGAGAPRFYYNVLVEQPKPSYAQIVVDTTGIADANWLVGVLGPTLASEVPGARIEVKKLEQGPPVGAPIQIRFSGDDPVAVAATARAARARLETVPGATAVRDSLGDPTATLRAHLDRDRAIVAGVNDAAVQQLVALAYGGVAATSIREGDRQTPVVVRLPAALRSDASRFGALAVSANGGRLPLAEIARVEPETQTSVATYRDGFSTVTVLANVDGRLPNDVLRDYRAAARDLRLPAGVRSAYAGEDEQTTKSFRNLLVAVIVGLLINQIVLLWEFRTVRLSLVVLCAVPLGLVGAVAGLSLMGEHFGFIASLGISSLGGIVTNHAIVLFEYAKREMEHGVAMDEALIDAGAKRLRPILLTVLASILGLLPLALGEQTLWRPFCWAVIFGLGGSMLMTLVAIPAIYRLVAGRSRIPEATPHELHLRPLDASTVRSQ